MALTEVDGFVATMIRTRLDGKIMRISDLRLTPLVSITVSSAIGMAETKLDHLVCNVAMLRHHLRQHAAIAIFALISVLDAGRAHETLKLLGSAIR